MSAGPIAAVEIATRVLDLIEDLIDIDDYARETLDLLGLLDHLIDVAAVEGDRKNVRRTILFRRVEIAQSSDEIAHLIAQMSGLGGVVNDKTDEQANDRRLSVSEQIQAKLAENWDAFERFMNGLPDRKAEDE